MPALGGRARLFAHKVTPKTASPRCGPIKRPPKRGEIAGRPWPEVQAIQETRLRHQLAYLEGNSEFYRAKLKAAGVAFDQIRTTADLVRIPFTLKTEIRTRSAV